MKHEEYKPSREEIKKAEEMMTGEERELSNIREVREIMTLEENKELMLSKFQELRKIAEELKLEKSKGIEAKDKEVNNDNYLYYSNDRGDEFSEVLENFISNFKSLLHETRITDYNLDRSIYILPDGNIMEYGVRWDINDGDEKYIVVFSDLKYARETLETSIKVFAERIESDKKDLQENIKLLEELKK